MPVYRYRALTGLGDRNEGTIEAPNEGMALIRLQVRKLQVLDLQEETSGHVTLYPPRLDPAQPQSSSTLREAEKELTDLLARKKTLDEKISVKNIVQQDFPGLAPRTAAPPQTVRERFRQEMDAIKDKAAHGRYRFISSFLVKDYDIVIFTRQFYYMLNTGVPIPKALKVLHENQTNPVLKNILRDIQKDLLAGMTIARSFSRFSEIFSPTYIAMVQIGEESGKLDAAFRSILAFIEKDFEMKRKIGASLVYPCFILSMAFILMVAMVFYFVPVFIKVFEQMHLDLPIPTRILVFVVKAVQRPEVIFLLFNLLILGTVGGVVAARTAQGSRTIDTVKLTIPMLGPTLLQIALARFARSFSMMIGAGIPVIRAFAIIVSTTTLMPLKDAVDSFATSVKEGIAFSNVRLDPKIFPKLFISFLKAGEESGTLPGTLERLAEIYDEDIAVRLDSLVNLIEPLFLTVVSFVVGYVLIAIFLPLYGVLNSFS